MIGGSARVRLEPWRESIVFLEFGKNWKWPRGEKGPQGGRTEN